MKYRLAAAGDCHVDEILTHAQSLGSPGIGSAGASWGQGAHPHGKALAPVGKKWSMTKNGHQLFLAPSFFPMALPSLKTWHCRWV